VDLDFDLDLDMAISGLVTSLGIIHEVNMHQLTESVESDSFIMDL